MNTPRIMPEGRITTLNMGLGRDSIAMLCLLIEDGLVAQGRKLTKDDIDCVVFSDLDAEWDHTYAQLPKVRALCEEHGIRFIVLAKPSTEAQDANWAERAVFRAANPGKKVTSMPGWFIPWAWKAGKAGWKSWADRTWGTIEDKAAAGGYHLRGSIIPSFTKRSPKPTIASRRGDCTDNHKIHPIRKLIRDLCWERFNVSCNEWSKLVKAGSREKHLTLLGIAADEVSRTEKGGKGPGFITEAYPLVEMGITKGEEQPILERWGFGDVKKSGCRMCPFQGIAWFAVLKMENPEQFAEAVEYEATALALNPKMFVSGGRPLTEQVERWMARNPDPDIEAILDKSYSRCSKLRKIEKKAA